MCVHVHFCVFTFTSPSVCAWKCVPRIVCLYKQMDENLRLLRSLSLRLSFFFFFLSHSRLVRAAQRRLCPFHQKDFPPSDSECASSSSSNCHRFFVNWDDVQLSGKKKKKNNSRGFVFFCFLFPLCFSFSPRGLALHITPDTMGRACKIQRAALQTSWNLLCVYSNNFNPWFFTEQLQRCVWLWLKVFSMEKRTERSQIKSLCYCVFLRSTFFFFFFNLDTLDFFLFRKQQVGFLQIQIGVSCSFQN